MRELDEMQARRPRSECEELWDGLANCSSVLISLDEPCDHSSGKQKLSNNVTHTQCGVEVNRYSVIVLFCDCNVSQECFLIKWTRQVSLSLITTHGCSALLAVDSFLHTSN